MPCHAPRTIAVLSLIGRFFPTAEPTRESNLGPYKVAQLIIFRLCPARMCLISQGLVTETLTLSDRGFGLRHYALKVPQGLVDGERVHLPSHSFA